MTNSPGAENLMFARELFATWKACGLGCVVLAPGARCAALALAARDTGLHVVRIDDERSAGFVALGWARVEGRPLAREAGLSEDMDYYMSRKKNESVAVELAL